MSDHGTRGWFEMAGETPQVPHLVLFSAFAALLLTLGCWAMIQAWSEVDKRGRIRHAIIGMASTVGGAVAGCVLGAR